MRPFKLHLALLVLCLSVIACGSDPVDSSPLDPGPLDRQAVLAYQPTDQRYERLSSLAIDLRDTGYLFNETSSWWEVEKIQVTFPNGDRLPLLRWLIAQQLDAGIDVSGSDTGRFFLTPQPVFRRHLPPLPPGAPSDDDCLYACWAGTLGVAACGFHCKVVYDYRAFDDPERWFTIDPPDPLPGTQPAGSSVGDGPPGSLDDPGPTDTGGTQSSGSKGNPDTSGADSHAPSDPGGCPSGRF